MSSCCDPFPNQHQHIVNVAHSLPCKMTEWMSRYTSFFHINYLGFIHILNIHYYIHCEEMQFCNTLEIHIVLGQAFIQYLKLNSEKMQPWHLRSTSYLTSCCDLEQYFSLIWKQTSSSNLSYDEEKTRVLGYTNVCIKLIFQTRVKPLLDT